MLIGLLTDFRRIWPLANGWRTKCSPVVFCHADFADDADFFRGSFFVPQISQISTDFFMESLCPILGGICNDRTGRLRENP